MTQRHAAHQASFSPAARMLFSISNSQSHSHLVSIELSRLQRIHVQCHPPSPPVPSVPSTTPLLEHCRLAAGLRHDCTDASRSSVLHCTVPYLSDCTSSPSAMSHHLVLVALLSFALTLCDGDPSPKQPGHPLVHNLPPTRGLDVLGFSAQRAVPRFVQHLAVQVGTCLLG